MIPGTNEDEKEQKPTFTVAFTTTTTTKIISPACKLGGLERK